MTDEVKDYQAEIDHYAQHPHGCVHLQSENGQTIDAVVFDHSASLEEYKEARDLLLQRNPRSSVVEQYEQ